MRKTKKAIKELISEASKHKELRDVIIEHLEKNGFKRFSFEKWSFDIKSGGKTIAAVILEISKGGEVVAQVNFKQKLKTKLIKPKTLKELDDELNSLIKGIINDSSNV